MLLLSVDIFGIVLSLIALVHIHVSVLMLSVLRFTKTIPFASKFLSTGLILFDVGLITTTAVIRMQKHPLVSSHISVTSALFQELAYATMALMAVERMLVLKWPMKYVRIASERIIKSVTCVVWISVVLLLLLTRYLLCLANTSSIWAVLTDERTCEEFLMIYHLAFVTLGQAVSTVSYIVVMKIVRRQTLRDYMSVSVKSAKSALRMYKSTGLVFIYIIVMTITSLLVYVGILLKRANLTSDEETRAMFQSASVFNCVLDPFLYVLWYEECREVCRKLLKKLFCRFSGKHAESVSKKNTNTVFQINSEVN